MSPIHFSAIALLFAVNDAFAQNQYAIQITGVECARESYDCLSHALITSTNDASDRACFVRWGKRNNAPFIDPPSCEKIIYDGSRLEAPVTASTYSHMYSEKIIMGGIWRVSQKSGRVEFCVFRRYGTKSDCKEAEMTEKREL